MRSRFRLSEAEVDVDLRGSYVHVVARGTLTCAAEVDEFYRMVEMAMQEHRVRRALIDAREHKGEPDPEVRLKAWEGLVSGRRFDRVAYVVGEGEDLKATRINMTGLSFGAPIRAFETVLEAHRWLSTMRKASGEMGATKLSARGTAPVRKESGAFATEALAPAPTRPPDECVGLDPEQPRDDTAAPSREMSARGFPRRG